MKRTFRCAAWNFHLAAVLFSSLLLGLAISARGADVPAKRPNVIFILADDMRWDAMSCAGNPVLKTPNLDRLAAGGMRFTNAFVTTAICAVSRACILTGQYARRNGVNDFATPIRDLATTYPVALRRSGYYTGFIGKWGTADSNRGYFQKCAREFDFWAGDMGQTAYWHERTCNYVTNNGTTDRANFFCSCPPKGHRNAGCGANGPNAELKNPVHAETQFVPAKIRSFLDQRDVSKPFCLSVSLKAPHAPWQGYAPRFADDFEGVEIPRRANVSLEEALRQPDFLRSSLESDRGLRFVKDLSLNGERNRLVRQYYRLIEGLDFCVGEVLKELQQRGLADNTVILFTSDNGHFSGEHGFFGKWFMHEESFRVPLILSDPRLPVAQRGRTSDAMTINLDIAPTILELAGQRAPPAMQGQSLLPLLADPKRDFRDAFFYEHLFIYSAGPPDHIQPSEGVRTRDWKYIDWLEQKGPAREELYDLRNDPLEMKNLAAVPEHGKMLEQLRQMHRKYTESLR